MSQRAPVAVRLALGLVAAVLLIVQITATRLLSATVSYHGAFGVLGLVMLGLAASGASVYRDRARPPQGDDRDGPASDALIRGAIALVLFTLAFVGVAAAPVPASAFQPLAMLVAAGGLYASFHHGGYAVAWLMSSWSRDISRLYFADLVGAGLGCALAVPLLRTLTPMQIFVACGALLALAASLLRRGRRGGDLAFAGVCGALWLGSAVVPDALRLRTAKGLDQSDVLFEHWNQLSRVTVVPEVPGTREAVALLGARDPNAAVDELTRKWSAGWGISENWSGTTPRSLFLQHDTDAGTAILEGGGTRPLTDFDVLRWDVTAIPYWLRQGDLDQAFVIGGGGGRDFLTSLAFGARGVHVVELNPSVVRAVEEVFADFSGRPYSRPGVRYEVGEARNVLSRSPDRYDVVQMSMIDTWAASMSGAMTLSENALYTREAFRLYLDRLSDDGILTVSRWYGVENHGETTRVLSLMQDALANAGAADPGAHVALVATSSSVYRFGVANAMMKRSPFTEAELASLATQADRMGFVVLWPKPGAVMGVGADAVDLTSLFRDGPPGGELDLSPPTDDRPFFFNLRSPFTSWVTAAVNLDPSRGSRSSMLFAAMAAIIVLVSWVFVFKPMAAAEADLPAADRVSLREAAPEIAYFGGIGVAFMFVELGLLQRYILFLGHPTYAISVVLLALLWSTGVGSLATDRWPGLARVALPALFVMLGVTAFVVPILLQAAYPAELPVRIALATALLVPLGACMGVAWPTGVRGLGASGRERLVPWMWAVNGVGGTLASVVGMLVATSWGYTALLLLGALGYAAVYGLVRRQQWAR